MLLVSRCGSKPWHPHPLFRTPVRSIPSTLSLTSSVVSQAQSLRRSFAPLSLSCFVHATTKNESAPTLPSTGADLRRPRLRRAVLRCPPNAVHSVSQGHSQEWPARIPSTQSTKVPLSPTSLGVDALLT